MNKPETASLVDGFYGKPRLSQDPDALAVEAALFLEQALGIAMTDDDMTPELAISREALAAFIAGRTAGA